MKNEIIARLEREILPLQGLRRVTSHSAIDTGLAFMRQSFPAQSFPLGAVHEFIEDDKGATAGFLAGLLSSLMAEDGVTVWISPTRTIFPPGLKIFGIAPEKIIFIALPNERDRLWALEESLKCPGLAAVVGELKQLSFTASRRLQLAVEKSCVTGFILCTNLNNTTASVTKWRITSLPGILFDDMPGVGFPQWNVELIKVRNGKPGSWQVGWVNHKFLPVFDVAVPLPKQQKKTG